MTAHSGAAPVVGQTQFPIWKTIKLGTEKTPDEYRKALKEAGYRIGDWANDILNKVVVSAQVSEVDLVNISVGELGFAEGAQYQDICARAVEMGSELCPAEVGPALRLTYKDQPPDEWLRVAMEAIVELEGYRGIFAVDGGYGGLWLHGGRGHPGIVWDADERFLFVRRK